MADKRFESERGYRFTQEELEDLPAFDRETQDFDDALEYENAHGITPDEVDRHMRDIRREEELINEADSEQELDTDTMKDQYGRKYEQYKLDLSDDDLKDLNDDTQEMER